MWRPKTRTSVGRWLVLATLCVLAGSAPAAASLHTYRTGLDSDNDPGTGCAFSLGAVAPGTLPGFEQQLTVLVDDDPVPPQVVSAQLESCGGGSFGDPQALTGFELELDSGLLGSDSVVGAIPAQLLGYSPTVRLAHHALAASGAEDALFTTDGSPDGPAILVEGVVEVIPVWSPWGAVLTTLLLAGCAWLLLRQRLPPSTLIGLVLVVLGLGTVAAVFAAWGDPAATDATADAVPADTRAEIFASFAMPNGGLGLRLDIEDIPYETACNDLSDNDEDGLIDCGDANCAQQVCSDANGCTLADTCQPLGGGGALVCVGTPVNCEAVVGNECSLDLCQSLGPDSYTCNSLLDQTKVSFGSCTPDDACLARAPDGSCTSVVDLCQVGRCFEQAGTPPQFLCEGAEKTTVPVDQGGCDDGDACTLDTCDAGVCMFQPVAGGVSCAVANP